MHTGYAGATTQQTLDHLSENYGIITAVDIEDNDTRMREPYNPTFPIETLFHQMELAVEYPLPASGLIKPPKSLVALTSLSCKLDYTQKLVAKDEKQLALKTWPLFKTFFTTALFAIYV